MGNEMEQAADAILQAAQEASLDELSEIEVDGDGSSSLSEIEYRDNPQDEETEASDDRSNESDEENDSEAETDRLEQSPNLVRTHKDIVLSSANDGQIYERSPSKLNNQILADDQGDDEEEDVLSDDDISLHESHKSSVQGDTAEPITVATSLEDSSGEGKRTLSAVDADTRKRKRSIMAGSGLDNDIEEPLRKRTGSIMTPGDDYAVEDEEQPDEEGDTSNPISGNISGEEGGENEEDVPDEVEEPAVAEEAPETTEITVSPKKRGRKKKKPVENGVNSHDEEQEAPLEETTAVNGDDEIVENDGDEAEAAMKNEEELERKRIALEQLGAIERQFATFRDRLYDEGLEQLNREEAMLREDKPTHPEYLAMMKCIDARRDERFRISEKLREYELQALGNYAVARRSQILVQYQQDARDIREKKLEQLGQQWYEIQHDRRSYAGSVPDYTLKFPTRRSQQIMNQVAYGNEVSILSGIAKYVGFPAAPPMTPATDAELEEDLQKMGRAKQPHAAQPAGLPFQELAALRMAGSTSRFKPAEEQFIEQTPWANPQHPSHAHLLQRQTSAQQAPRTSSPFSQTAQPRRHSDQLDPASGTFSSSAVNGAAFNTQASGQLSPRTSVSNTSHTLSTTTMPQDNRPASFSPLMTRPKMEESSKVNGIQHASIVPGVVFVDKPREFPPEVRREQAPPSISHF
ncbi:hypothetical protein OIDMADRAFT_167767 [Oidiodendron maius Zn]|uniref:Transcriptional regulatory protein DEP1 n=1 Tax=Oidiodendron maius (strain Zn) TaxID=913774 RepID=A0A0C3H2T4_OIDMZ|nr:hypothetical protein OIDMADRAFT_167767 [Oidiodendron maius Zn]